MSNPYSDALGRPTRDVKPRKEKPRPKPKAKPSPSHLRAKKQESETASRLRGGRLTPASGAGEVVKGDVRIHRVARIECKTTKNKSFPVTMELIRKIEDAALPAGETPVLLVEFNENGKKIGEVAIIPAYLLEEFCERAATP